MARVPTLFADENGFHVLRWMRDVYKGHGIISVPYEFRRQMGMPCRHLEARHFPPETRYRMCHCGGYRLFSGVLPCAGRLAHKDSRSMDLGISDSHQISHRPFNSEKCREKNETAKTILARLMTSCKVKPQIRT